LILLVGHEGIEPSTY